MLANSRCPQPPAIAIGATVRSVDGRPARRAPEQQVAALVTPEDRTDVPRIQPGSGRPEHGLCRFALFFLAQRRSQAVADDAEQDDAGDRRHRSSWNVAKSSRARNTRSPTPPLPLRAAQGRGWRGSLVLQRQSKPRITLRGIRLRRSPSSTLRASSPHEREKDAPSTSVMLVAHAVATVRVLLPVYGSKVSVDPPLSARERGLWRVRQGCISIIRACIDCETAW